MPWEMWPCIKQVKEKGRLVKLPLSQGKWDMGTLELKRE